MLDTDQARQQGIPAGTNEIDRFTQHPVRREDAAHMALGQLSRDRQPEQEHDPTGAISTCARFEIRVTGKSFTGTAFVFRQ
jgi:hypothetical protein